MNSQTLSTTKRYGQMKDKTIELQMNDPISQSWELVARFETAEEAKVVRDREIQFHPELELTSFQIIDTTDGDWRPVH